MNVRFTNFFTSKAGPTPALDIYDTPTGQAATPLVTNLRYGSVSAYIRPHAPVNELTHQPVVTFYALPAGEDPVAKQADAQPIGGIQDEGSHPQTTVVLTADTPFGTAPLAGLSFSTQVEKGSSQGSAGPVAPAPPPGQGELIIDTYPVSDLNLGLYLIDGTSCQPPINGDTSVPGVPYIFNSDSATIKSAFAIFPTAPGPHQVSVVAWKSSTQPTCAQLTAKQGTTTINIAAGQQVMTYVYGASATDLHLSAAPVKQ